MSRLPVKTLAHSIHRSTDPIDPSRGQSQTQRAMASSSSSGTAAGAGSRAVLSEEGAAAAMAECIGLLFGRWTALQLAVQNRWGGLDS